MQCHNKMTMACGSWKITKLNYFNGDCTFTETKF